MSKWGGLSCPLLPIEDVMRCPLPMEWTPRPSQAAFCKLGWVEGNNLIVERRYAIGSWRANSPSWPDIEHFDARLEAGYT